MRLMYWSAHFPQSRSLWAVAGSLIYSLNQSVRQSVSWPAATITNSAELNFISIRDLHRTAEESRNEETKLVFNILPLHPNSPADSYLQIYKRQMNNIILIYWKNVFSVIGSLISHIRICISESKCMHNKLLNSNSQQPIISRLAYPLVSYSILVYSAADVRVSAKTRLTTQHHRVEKNSCI